MNALSNQQARPGRPRARIGADEARAWVRKLRLGNPYAKAVLMATANYMNEDGSAYPGITTLHLDTDIAEDTVINRLKWCEGIGAIALFKSWVDENGRRNHDGRGRTTSTEIRFLFDADLDEIADKAAGASKPKALRGAALASHEAAISPRPHGEPIEESSPRPHGELAPVSPSLAPDQPPTPADRREEVEESKKEPPLPPKGGDGQAINQDLQASEASKATSWQRFEKAWSEPILRQSIARQVWSALTESEEDLAIKAAKGYVEWRRRQKKPPNVINAHTFLREREAWPGFAAQAPAEKTPTSALVFVAEGSEDWQALRVISAIWGEGEPQAMTLQCGRGLMIPKPLTPAKLALAMFATEGEIDISAWFTFERGNQLGAWREFLGIEPRNIVIGHERKEVLGKVYQEWPIKITAIRVPCQWPPLKDGTIRESGPPQRQSTDSDLSDFT